MELFQNQEIIESFQTKIKKKLEEKSRESNNIHERWDILEEAVLYGAKLVGSNETKDRTAGWFDVECEGVSQESNIRRQKRINEPSEENKRSFCEARRKGKTTCRQNRRKHLENKLEKMEAVSNKKRYKRILQRY